MMRFSSQAHNGGGVTVLRFVRFVVGVVVVVTLAFTSVASGEAGRPWWHLGAEPVPTDLNQSAERSEVQELAVDGTGGDVLWVEPVSLEELHEHRIVSSELKFAVFPFNAPAAEVQHALEASGYPSGSVQVGGGPAVTGTGTLPATVIGKGTLTEGSPVVEEVTASTGAFVEGQAIEGKGIVEGTTIVSVEPGKLMLSANATRSGGGVSLTVAGSKVIENVVVSSGAFAAGQEILAGGIPAGTTIEKIEGSTLTLSQATTKTRAGASLSSPLHPYVLSYVGALARRPVAAPPSFFGLAGFFGGVQLEGSASVVVLTPGHAAGEMFVTALNLGGVSASGCSRVPSGTGGYLDVDCSEVASPAGTGEYEATPITLSDVLPAGYEAVGIEGEAFEGFSAQQKKLVCSLRGENGVSAPACSFAGRVPPYSTLTLRLRVDLAGVRGGEQQVASVSGGGAQPASLARAIPLGASTPFGIADYEFVNENEGGAPDTQAGSHPFQQTTTVIFNQTVGAGGRVEPAALPKDLNFFWPPGLIGNPAILPQCPLVEFLATNGGCPADTAVGVAKTLVTFEQGGGPSINAESNALYNLVPSRGEPARLGFQTGGGPVYVDPSVRSGEDYGITVNTDNITQLAGFRSAEVTVWGVPGAASHDAFRGQECLFVTARGESCVSSPVEKPAAFLSLPTACSGALVSTVTGDSWAEPRLPESQSLLAEYSMPALDGCDALPFHPSISVAPDGQQGSTPTGLSVALHVPQEETTAPGGLAEAAVNDTTVVLPVGVQLSPAAADGLLSCSTMQEGYTGLDPHSGAAQFTPGAVECANASKVGTVFIKTPLLPEPVEGGVYLGTQDENPFGSLVALYLDAENQNEGIAVKLAGEVKLDERTGQIVTVFPNSPEIPFEEANVHFFGGERAPLSTPPSCGSYTSTASFTPWSSSEPSPTTSTFQITSGPNGTPCQTPRPFQPGFQAGTTSVQAGGYSPLTLTISRPDPDQPLGKLAVIFPPGISAGLRGVKLCEEPQATQGTCPPESQIGKVIASAGLGGDPYSVETGKAYITGPYEGDPFGVEIVVPAIAGPFNLGTEIVRSKVNVDPTDAHLTVVSDPFPTILDGIPLQLQHINVTVNRPGFVFNPTSCEPMKLTGELESTEGATANVQTPFQVTNCAALSFKPEFNVQTSAHTSRTEGASLHVTLTLPAGAQGTKANVAKVRVSLPKQLPSPLKTLQKACTEKVFAENPASCPKASRVGEATVGTPVLEGPLSGPAYFVSHGGAKYPELIIVLTGEDGVTVQVHGETFISKQGITTATFSTVPDVPFSTFELTLPKRESPALTANGNLCKGTLIMPTEFVGQNGLKITQETKIAVTGCPKSAHVKHKKKGKHQKRGKR